MVAVRAGAVEAAIDDIRSAVGSQSRIVPLVKDFLVGSVHAALGATLTDRSSTFGPSMYRDMAALRPVEITVLSDLADRARDHHLSTPLLDASTVAIDVHNRRLAAESPFGSS